MIDWLFQLYGSAASQTVIVSSPVTTVLITKCSVAIESQPATLVNVAVKSPAAVIDWLFQLYVSAASQTVIVTSPVTTVLITKCSVAIESQPATLVNVAV